MTKMGEYFVSNIYIYIYLQSIKFKDKIENCADDSENQCKKNDGIDVDIYKK